jgi:hypothetical protein
MYFLGEETIPGAPAFPAYCGRIRAYLAQARSCTAEDAMAHFFGFALPAAAFPIVGIDHVALYLGDYSREESIDAWVEFLRDDASVGDVHHGPSYIAPKYYGTPGYWINCTVDGASVEMFSCKRYASWRGRDHLQKVGLMSHYALTVDDAAHVGPLITYFSQYPGLGRLAFVPGDELGHTYGHLINHAQGRVLELVHDARRHDPRRSR